MEEKMNNNVENTTEQSVEKKGFLTEEQKAKGKQVGKTIGKWALRLGAVAGAFALGKALGSTGKEDSDDNDIVYIIEPSDEQ